MRRQFSDNTEKAIVENLAFEENIIIACPRLSTVRNADKRVVLMEAGSSNYETMEPD
jgi:ABC-type multidrug transport system fused ATPase/permease subunit